MTRREPFNLLTPGVELLLELLGVLRAGDHMAETRRGLDKVRGQLARVHPHPVVDHEGNVERFFLL